MPTPTARSLGGKIASAKGDEVAPAVQGNAGEAKETFQLLHDRLLNFEDRLCKLEQLNSRNGAVIDCQKQVTSEGEAAKAESGEKHAQLIVDAISSASVDPLSEDALEKCISDELPKHTDGGHDLEKSIMTGTQEYIDEHMEYTFEESVYDSLLIVFVRSAGVSILQSCGILFGLVMHTFIITMTLQVLGGEEFSKKPFAHEDMSKWRYEDAHAYTMINPSTQMSLANRVCNKDSSLSIANSQMNLVYEVDQYRGGDQGLLLCNVAIGVWFLCCASEIRAAINFFLAIWGIRRASATSISIDNDGVEFIGLTLSRAILCTGVSMLRIGFALLFVSYGSIWLAHTIAIQSLLLNASALGFILEVDDYIFRIVAPMRVVQLIKKMKPAHLPMSRTVHYIPVSLSAAIIGFMVFANFVLIDDMLDEMKKARSILCDPEESLQYIVGVNELQWITFTKNTPTWGETVESDAISLQSGIISKLAANPREFEEYAHDSEQFVALQHDSLASIEQFVEAHGGCRDYNALMGKDPSSLGKRLWAISGNRSFLDVRSCHEVASYCTTLDILGTNVRYMCSETCGCGSMHAGLWDMGRPQHGCPQKTCKRRIKNSLKDAPCRDQNSTFLSQSGWSFLLKRLLDTKHLKEDQHSNFTTLGCEAVQYLPDNYQTGWNQLFDLCSLDEGATTYGLAPFCPVSCRCSTAASNGASSDCEGLCPQTCCKS